ncbi:hypothetical protein MESS4_340038 [Mesorhizobium sp. STM 4661]|nr:hypothetical protein MESS4_340038 [Mesorhizobium sp. STM 4661]
MGRVRMGSPALFDLALQLCGRCFMHHSSVCFSRPDAMTPFGEEKQTLFRSLGPRTTS